MDGTDNQEKKPSKKRRDVPISMRITAEDRELLRQLSQAMDEYSDTQTVIKLIREKARALGLLK